MHDLTSYRRIRLLTGGVIPFVLAAALLAFARWSDPTWETGAQTAGICRELIAGTTEGRQALFGSCWVAPLPVLFYLPFAWLLPEPFAGGGAFLAAWLFVFWCVREALKSADPSGWRIAMVQAALAAWLMLGRNAEIMQVPAALTLGLMMLAAAGLAWWIERRKTRDIVSTAAAAAGLVLCGFPAFAPATLTVVCLPLAALGHRDTRKRFPAWLLLGGLPLVYAFSVWMLMNRLMLGDSLFFLRSLNYLMPEKLTIASPNYGQMFIIALFMPALILLPALILTWWKDSRAKNPGAGAVPAVAAMISLALAVAVYAHIFLVFSIDWPVMLLHATALAILFLTFGRLGRVWWLRIPALAVLAYFGSVWIKPAAVTVTDNRAEICRDVESYVNARTPYGRVFAMGYAGMDLLRGYEGERILPNLDLQLTALRRNYKGQNLYVLVPNPVGVNRAESVFWRYPDIYALGTDRLILRGTFGSWRLFELITAPTQEQLDEWKSP
ncbi:MAG: hypothetical protein FWH21_03060 [Kiritimatiellaeota bacterium]|nr:hypothetical protein [Kiritimatiellota bacterium]